MSTHSQKPFLWIGTSTRRRRIISGGIQGLCTGSTWVSVWEYVSYSRCRFVSFSISKLGITVMEKRLTKYSQPAHSQPPPAPQRISWPKTTQTRMKRRKRWTQRPMPPWSWTQAWSTTCVSRITATRAAAVPETAVASHASDRCQTRRRYICYRLQRNKKLKNELRKKCNAS